VVGYPVGQLDFAHEAGYAACGEVGDRGGGFESWCGVNVVDVGVGVRVGVQSGGVGGGVVVCFGAHPFVQHVVAVFGV